MKIVTADCTVRMGGGVELAPLAPVVVPDGIARQLAESMTAEKLPLRVSGIGHYTRRYCGQDLSGRRLLVWRGCGWGDHLVVAGIVRILASRYPTARLELWCHPAVCRTLWGGVPCLPFVPRETPIPFGEWQRADYHLLLDDTCENDREPDQPCTWDGMLRAAGVEPEGVPDCRKVPLVPLVQADRTHAAEWLQDMGIGPDRPLVFWQTSSSTPIRSYPPEPTRRALELLAESRPDVAVVVSRVARDEVAYGALPPLANLFVCEGLPLRTVFGLLERATCVVCPDSVFGHAAAGLGTACVSLWSSFSPRDRVRYYGTHRPLYVESPCGYSPCRRHECEAVAEGCPRGTPAGGYCRGLAALEPAVVVAKVVEALEEATEAKE